MACYNFLGLKKVFAVGICFKFQSGGVKANLEKVYILNYLLFSPLPKALHCNYSKYSRPDLKNFIYFSDFSDNTEPPRGESKSTEKEMYNLYK